MTPTTALQALIKAALNQPGDTAIFAIWEAAAHHSAAFDEEVRLKSAREVVSAVLKGMQDWLDTPQARAALSAPAQDAQADGPSASALDALEDMLNYSGAFRNSKGRQAEIVRSALCARTQPATPVDAAATVPLQGGLSNAQLLAAWQQKLPGVTPSERDLCAFALGVEVGFATPPAAPQAAQPAGMVPLTDAAGMLMAACVEFVRKCDCGEAKSKRSYAQMQEAIAAAEAAGITADTAKGQING